MRSLSIIAALAAIAAPSINIAPSAQAQSRASTSTDANRCVTRPEVRLNDTFKNNTAAYVVNGCSERVDVRICLQTDQGWNCGVRWGVGPQERASYSSFRANGQVFVDARVSGSNTPLRQP